MNGITEHEMNDNIIPLTRETKVPAAARDAIARLQMQYVNAIDNGEFERAGIDLQWTDVPEGTGKLCQM